MPSKVKNTKKAIDSVKVMSAVATVVNFIKEQAVSDLVEASGGGKVDIDPQQLKKICFYVESSISNSFSKASGQIEAQLK